MYPFPGQYPDGGVGGDQGGAWREYLAGLPGGGDAEPILRRLRDPMAELESELWLLTHPDLRHLARINAAPDFLAETLAQQRDLLEGQRA